jgi:phosphoglycerate dehydrogenase-like enzyme
VARVKVVLTHQFDEEDVERLRELVPAADVRHATGETLADELADADAVLCFRLPGEAVAGASKLRLVQSLSAGADGIDSASLPPGAALCNVRGHERTMAEWVLMALLALPREVVRLDAELRKGVWDRPARRSVASGSPTLGDLLDAGEPELESKTVALVGYGQIGRAVEELLQPLGARTVAATRRARDGARPLTELVDVLVGADFAVVSLPGQAGTVVGERELDALGPDGYLVNVGRGSVVDEDALYAALRERRIAGAAIDVWYRYPREEGEIVEPSRYPFHELDNVLMSPHASGRSRLAWHRRWEFVAEQLGRLERGEPLENVLN